MIVLGIVLGAIIGAWVGIAVVLIIRRRARARRQLIGLSTSTVRFLPSDKGHPLTVDGQACEIVEVLSATSITIRPIK